MRCCLATLDRQVAALLKVVCGRYIRLYLGHLPSSYALGLAGMDTPFNLFNKSRPDADKNPEVRMVFLPDAGLVAPERRPVHSGGRPPAWCALAEEIKTTLRMAEIEREGYASLFAFPGAFLAARGLPGPASMGGILTAMVGVGSAAKAINWMACDPPEVKDLHGAGHTLTGEKVKPPDLSCAETALFAANGWIRILIAGIASTDLLWFKAR